MATNYNPRTVTDGLVFALDAANIKGYDKYENLVTYSEDFSDAAWVKDFGGVGSVPVITNNAGTDPNGTTTADRVQFALNGGTTTTDRSDIRQTATTTAGTYTLSFFVKSFDGSSTYNMFIRDANGTVNPIQVTPNWTRISITASTYPSGNVSLGIGIRGGQTPTNSNTADILVWGAQLERGSTANDYYPTSGTTKTRGTTLTDLSLTKNTATLLNTPTFSNTNGGYLSFASASSQYATAPNLGDIPRWTVETFVRFTSDYSTKVAMVVGGQYDGLSKFNFTIGTNNAPVNYNIAVGFFDGIWHTTNGINYALNTWFRIVGTYDGTTIRQYTNGTEVNSLNYTGTPSSGGEIRINRRWDSAVSSGNLFDTDIATVRIYNRALTAAEVQQNFNAGRARFSI